MANKRIYYAVQQVSIKGDTSGPWSTDHALHGVQSVGMTTTFNLDQVFELGQLAIYENIEGIPDVEVTLTKVLDGRPLMWHMATQDNTTTSPKLAGRSNSKAYVGISIYNDTSNSAGADTNFGISEVEMSGMFVSSLAYNIPLEDNMTEDVTLVGNNKIWASDPRVAGGATVWSTASVRDIPGAFALNNDAPDGTGGVQRRENLVFTSGIPEMTGENGLFDDNGQVNNADQTVVPLEVFGVSSSGTNEAFNAHLSSITVSADLGREELFELGRRGPYHRVVTFPIEVTCEIETTSHSGDMVSATEFGILGAGSACENPGNLSDNTIRLVTCEGTRIYLGRKNKLASVNYTGGDAGGGNVTVSYTYTTFNDFTVIHPLDPHSKGQDWWNGRNLSGFLTQ